VKRPATLAVALQTGSESSRAEIYDALYRPLTAMLRADNPNFDNLRFAEAVGKAEGERMAQDGI
jgi:hypothetical protein